MATLSIRVDDEFEAELQSAVKNAGMRMSTFLREAAEEKLARLRRERIAEISRQLRGQSVAANEAMDGSIADGLE